MLTYAIDFGTSNSILGAANESGVRGFAPLDPGAPDPLICRSLIYFANSKEAFFGARAIEEFVARDHTGRLIRSIKKQLPSRSFACTYVDNRALALEDLIGSFLGELRRRANAHFGEEVTGVVLGRPARFAEASEDDAYAQGRLEKAARIAGFKHIEFLPEPVAAAIGYEVDLAGSSEQIVLAADYGGGTSDFTIYRATGRHFKPSDVISIGGVSVAGDALDASLMRSRISRHFGTGVQYKVPFGANVLTMPRALMEQICHPAEISLLRKQDTMEFFRNVQQWSLGADDRARMDQLFTLLNDQLGFPLFEKIEATKIALSREESASFEFRYPGVKIREKIARRQFEQYAGGALEKIVAALDDTLAGAGLSADRIDRVLCTGGTGRVPFIRRSLIERFGEHKLFDLDPFRGVATGLARRAHELTCSSRHE